MEQCIAMATPQKKAADARLYELLQDPQAQLISRTKQWEIAMDPKWMAEYEDPEVVKYRISLRPVVLHVQETATSAQKAEKVENTLPNGTD